MDVFIVEDSEIVSDELKDMLSEISGIHMAGLAIDEQDAIEKIGATRPDVVILDIALRSGSGIKVLQSIKKSTPLIKVIILTNYTDACYVNSCINAGADYFFDKSLQFMNVATVIQQLVANDGVARNNIGGDVHAH